MTTASAADRRAVTEAVFGHMRAQALAAALRLGLPDRLGPEPGVESDGSVLAAELGIDEQSTVRLLRALAATGFATEPRPGIFAPTGSGALLAADHPASLADFVAMFLDPAMVASWQRLDDGVRHGRTVFDDVFGVDFFGHLAANPALSARFNAAMRQGTVGVAQVLPQVVDLTRFRSLTDVGGGDGTLLAAALAACPDLRGVLFDSAAGSAEAAPVLAGVAERCSVVSGDFFAAVPAGSDAYLLKSIVHDWDDAQVVTILGHVRAALPEDGRVLVVEPVLPATVDGSMPGVVYLSDLNMLVNVGGRERTEEEFRALCSAAGLAVTAVTPLPATGFSVVEAAPA